jgi:hypothetical protein
MNEFITKHQKRILGVLSGFDRVRFRGTFRVLAVAKLLLVKIQFLASSQWSKENLVAKVIRRKGLTEGVVCVLGLSHVRIQAWLPFTVHVCVNGRAADSGLAAVGGVEHSAGRLGAARLSGALGTAELRWPAARVLQVRIPQSGVDVRFNGEVVTKHLVRPEGVCIKHRLNRNTLKSKIRLGGMYDKQGSVLRVETTINDTSDFGVHRASEQDPSGPKKCGQTGETGGHEEVAFARPDSADRHRLPIDHDPAARRVCLERLPQPRSACGGRTAVPDHKRHDQRQHVPQHRDQ